MRSTLLLALTFSATFACGGELEPTMTNEQHPLAPLFAVGSNEQLLLDKFLARFTFEKAAEFHAAFATRGTTVISATDPEVQKEIDAIYKALSRRPDNTVRMVAARTPGPRETVLIDELLASVPVGERSALRHALLASNATITTSNAENRRRIEEIYKVRREESEENWRREH